jgi:hypothetical protein
MSEPFRLARLQVWPSATATRDDVARGFGPACTSATLTGMTDDHWLVSAVFDARLAPDAAVLLQHAQDDRLWTSWIEAQCSFGRCRVVDQRASASATPVTGSATPAR